MVLPSFFQCFMAAVCLLPFFAQAQTDAPRVPESRDWYANRIDWFRAMGGIDSLAGYQTLDSLNEWVETYGTPEDREWLTLSSARFWMQIQRHPLAMRTLDEMLDSTNSPFIQAHILLTLRDLHSEIEAYDQAIQFHEMIDWQAIPETPEAKAPSSFTAFTYAKIGSYDQAIANLQRSIEEMKAAGMPYYVVSYSNSLGVFYFRNGILDSALMAYRAAEEAMEQFFPEGKGLNPTAYRFTQGLIKGNVAQVLAKQGKHYEAIPLLKADIAASLTGKPPYRYRVNGIKSLIHLSNSYTATQQLELAEETLQRARKLLTKSDAAEDWVNYLHAQAELAKAQGDHERAFSVLYRAEELEDSALAASKKDRANNLLRTYRYSLDREIMERTEEVKRLRERNAQQRRFNWVFVGLVALALFTSIYFTVLYRQNKARRKDLEEKNKQIEEQKNLLEQSLQDQDILLREVNHRVKNNLQVISSMLFLEQRKTHSPILKQTLRDVQERIRTMSNIHQKLYMRQHAEGIELVFAGYVHDLVAGIIQSYSSEGQEITFTHEITVDQLPVDQTIPLSLILHELTTNSVKHAFLEASHGRIHMELSHETVADKPIVVLRYSDDGPGLTIAQLENQHRDTIGMKLIELLTHQLRGSISMKNNGGFQCEIRFPSRPAPPTFAA